MRDDLAFAQAFAACANIDPDGDDNFVSILLSVSWANRDRKRLVGILCRGVLSVSMAGAIGGKDTMMEKVILDIRNQTLARFAVQSPADKIEIGRAHV